MLCLLAAHALAAEIRPGLVSFRRIEIPDDIPAHLCTALAQDAQGYLWIGTQGGLVRYDGYRFRKMIPSGYVRALLVARDGRVWVGFFSGGLAAVDPATGAVTRYGSGRVEGLAEDRSGAIWAATNGGLVRVNGGRIEHVTASRRRGRRLAAIGPRWRGHSRQVRRRLGRHVGPASRATIPPRARSARRRRALPREGERAEHLDRRGAGRRR